MTEFGACAESPACAREIRRSTMAADAHLSSWAYWSYKYFNGTMHLWGGMLLQLVRSGVIVWGLLYSQTSLVFSLSFSLFLHCPTHPMPPDYTTQSGIGEGLFNADGTVQSTKVSELTRTYAEATAGTPLAMAFDRGDGSNNSNSNSNQARFTFSFALDAACAQPTLIYMNRADHYANGYAVDVQPPGAVVPVEQPDNRYAARAHTLAGHRRSFPDCRITKMCAVCLCLHLHSTTFFLNFSMCISCWDVSNQAGACSRIRPFRHRRHDYQCNNHLEVR
jgi:hypothetical protein